MNKIPTPHNESSNTEDFAKTVIMPGDPLRAKFIAETYLEDVKQVNGVRNMLAFTGYYKGQKLTVMGSGMGMPSMGIYSYELYNFYDVDNIIRIGSCGGFSQDLELYDVILATSVHSESNYAKVSFDMDEKELLPSNDLNEKLRVSAKENGLNLIEGKIATTDAFYKTTAEEFAKGLEKEGCIGVEMEAFSLFTNAKIAGKNAACLVTVSDHMLKEEATSAEERQNSFTTMMEIVLNAKY